MYFYKEFDESKNNCHEMWKTINSLLHKISADANSPSNNTKINGKICDNQLAIAEHFNIFFFCTVGKRLAGKKENSNSQRVTRYLTNGVFSSLFLELVDEREILSTINLLFMKKSVGHENIILSLLLN